MSNVIKVDFGPKPEDSNLSEGNNNKNLKTVTTQEQQEMFNQCYVYLSEVVNDIAKVLSLKLSEPKEVGKIVVAQMLEDCIDDLWEKK